MKDAHTHISLDAHAIAKKGARKAKITLKQYVDAAIKNFAKKLTKEGK